ncbi:MAG: ubiquinone biosynthesis protein [Myxococcota bacterium]|jgi:ubiquinone biosynthesis protein
MMPGIAPSLDLLGGMLGRWTRLRDDVTRDATRVAADAGAFWALAQQRARDIDQTGRSTPRFLRIVRDALFITGSMRVHRAAAVHLTEAEAATRLHHLHEANAARAYAACIELGGGVLKLGQLLSCRMDVLPAPWVAALSKLQDQVPGEPYDLIAARIEAELGRPADELFAFFDPEPLAAASLAQVHAARLHDGREVVVKVLRPGIEDVLAADVAALRFIAAALPGLLDGLEVGPVVSEVVRSLQSELCFRREADNAEDFGRAFADHPRVWIPEVYRELSSQSVLTLSRAPGISLALALEQRPEQRDQILETLVDCFCAQVLRYGLVHADPHPGNLMVTEDGRLILIDFGAVQRYTPDQRRAWAELAGAILARQPDKTARLLESLGFSTPDGDPAVLTAYAELFMEAFLAQAGGSLADIDPHRMMEEAIALGRSQPVNVPQHFVMLGRVFAALGGPLFHYQPSLNLFQILAPHLGEALSA